MNGIWMILWAGLRFRWRAWLAVAMIAGLFAGLVSIAAAGARRTESAYPRLIAWSRSPDLLIVSGFESGMAPLARAAIRGLPQASDMEFVGFGTSGNANLFAPQDNRIPGAFFHRKLLAGRLPDPGRADEVDISFLLAQARHLGVGSVLRLSGQSERGEPMTVALHVVGVEAAPGEFPPQVNDATGAIWATPAFYRAHRHGFQLLPAAMVRLRHGQADVIAAEHELAPRGGQSLAADSLAAQSANAERGIRPQAVALWLLAAMLAVTGLLVISQLVARLTVHEATSDPALRAIGVTQCQSIVIALGRAALIGAAAAGLGLVLALLLSPVFPLGLARIAEPHPGFDAEWPVLALAAAGTVLLTGVCALWPAWRVRMARSAGPVTAWFSRRPGRPAVPLTAAGPRSVTGLLGIRLALQPGAGPAALPVRSTIAGASAGAAALTAALVFSASLGHLLATPALYGATWDAAVTNTTSNEVARAGAAVNRDPEVSAWSIGFAEDGFLADGMPVGVLVMSPQRGGSLLPVPVQGRLPRQAGEVVLGAQTLAMVHARVGGTVAMQVPGAHARAKFTIVGTAVFPALSDGLQLGQGTLLTPAGLQRIFPAPKFQPPFDTILVRFRPHLGQQTALATLSSRVTRAGTFAVQIPRLPADLISFGRVQELPLILGSGFGAIALIIISYLLSTSVRRRRRDVAILRVLGCTRSQIRQTIVWQASTTTLTALTLGIPVGIACGRVAWQIFAHQLGIIPVSDVPSYQLAAMAPAALCAAVIIAAWPAETAARTKPAQALKSE